MCKGIKMSQSILRHNNTSVQLFYQAIMGIALCMLRKKEWGENDIRYLEFLAVNNEYLVSMQDAYSIITYG